MLLYHDEYQTVKHDRSNSLLEMDWTNESSKLIDTSYINRLKKVSECVERYRPTSLLANLEALVYNGTSSIEEWIQNEIYSKLDSSGVRKIAFIKSNDILTRILFEQILSKNNSNAVAIETFDNVEFAREWLLNNN